MAKKKDSILELWESKAKSEGGAPTATHPDVNLRKIEIEMVSRCLKPGAIVLDAGCGNGYGMKSYLRKKPSKIIGIDFSPAMIRTARRLLGNELKAGRVAFHVGDVTDLRLDSSSIDIVTATRCLINLGTKRLQQQAIREVVRVLKPGGTFLMIESSVQGLHAINELRVRFGLKALTTPWHNLKFDEEELLPFLERFFNIVDFTRFGTYFFLTRLVHPMMVAPAEPRYSARINTVARDLQLGLNKDPFDKLGSPFFVKLEKK